jgi:hypothetical protein
MYLDSKKYGQYAPFCVVYKALNALVVQWIGHSPAKGEMQVRFLPRAHMYKNLFFIREKLCFEKIKKEGCLPPLLHSQLTTIKLK